jgi:hypothetical protein
VAERTLDEIVETFQQHGVYRVALSDASFLPAPFETTVRKLGRLLGLTKLWDDYQAVFGVVQNLPKSGKLIAAVTKAESQKDAVKLLAISVDDVTAIYRFQFAFDFSPKTVRFGGLPITMLGVEVRHRASKTK